MGDRILDLSERPFRLRVNNSLLVLESEGFSTPPIPLADLAVVIVSHPQISFTQAVLSGLASAGAAFVTCDTKHRPVAMLLPLVTHSLQAERFAAQAALSVPARKQIWKQIIQAKIRAQGQVLRQAGNDDHGLIALSSKVRSGDPGNREAAAAQTYWKFLFGSHKFRRNDELDPYNSCLDYGYAVLRAIVARALCSSGLNPTLGIHHHNRYDPFCLADDLMEPFRPIVDGAVIRLVASRSTALQLDSAAKQGLLSELLGRFESGGESRTLFDWLARTSASLANIILGQHVALEIPELRHASP